MNHYETKAAAALPTGWKWVKLGDVCEIVTGTTPPTNEPANYGDDIPFAKPTQLIDKPLYSTPENLSKLGASKARIIPIHSVLVSCIGYLGKTAIVKQAVAFNQQLNAILPNNKIDGHYIFYQAQSPLFQKQLKELSSATTVAIVNKGKFSTISIPLPPLPIQSKIVARLESLLSELDNGKKQLLTAQAQLKTYRQAVLKAAFDGKFTNGTADWKWVKIGEVCQVNPKIPNRESIENELVVQFLPMKLVEALTNKIDLSEFKTYKEVKKGYTPFIEKDIIFAKVTPCMENGKIAIAQNLKNGIGFGSSEFHVLRGSNEIKQAYLFHFVIQQKFRDLAEFAMTGAVGLRRVPKQFLENYSIPLPPLDIQEKIVAAIESRLSICAHLEATLQTSLAQSETLRQSLLKQAFEGKLLKE